MTWLAGRRPAVPRSAGSPGPRCLRRCPSRRAAALTARVDPDPRDGQERGQHRTRWPMLIARLNWPASSVRSAPNRATPTISRVSRSSPAPRRPASRRGARPTAWPGAARPPPSAGRPMRPGGSTAGSGAVLPPHLPSLSGARCPPSPQRPYVNAFTYRSWFTASTCSACSGGLSTNHERRGANGPAPHPRTGPRAARTRERVTQHPASTRAASGPLGPGTLPSDTCTPMSRSSASPGRLENRLGVTRAGPHAARPGMRFGYRCWMNCVVTVRVSPLASMSVQVAV